MYCSRADLQGEPVDHQGSFSHSITLSQQHSNVAAMLVLLCWGVKNHGVSSGALHGPYRSGLGSHCAGIL